MFHELKIRNKNLVLQNVFFSESKTKWLQFQKEKKSPTYCLTRKGRFPTSTETLREGKISKVFFGFFSKRFLLSICRLLLLLCIFATAYNPCFCDPCVVMPQHVYFPNVIASSPKRIMAHRNCLWRNRGIIMI